MGVGQSVPCRGATCIIHPSRLLGSSSKHAVHCRVDRYTGGTSVSSPSRPVYERGEGRQSQFAVSAKDSWPAGIPVRSRSQVVFSGKMHVQEAILDSELVEVVLPPLYLLLSCHLIIADDWGRGISMLEHIRNQLVGYWPKGIAGVQEQGETICSAAGIAQDGRGSEHVFNYAWHSG